MFNWIVWLFIWNFELQICAFVHPSWLFSAPFQRCHGRFVRYLIVIFCFNIEFWYLNFDVPSWICFLLISDFWIVDSGATLCHVAYNAWQRVAVCCNVCQSVAECCSVLQCLAECCRVLQCVAYNAWQRVAVCCSVLQCVAECCSVLPPCKTLVVQVACSLCVAISTPSSRKKFYEVRPTVIVHRQFTSDLSFENF